jgi:hypothetical protein
MSLNFGSKTRADAMTAVTSAAKSVLVLAWSALVIACTALAVAIFRR